MSYNKSQTAALSNTGTSPLYAHTKYDKPGYEPPDRRIHVDGELVKELRDEIVEVKQARDGIAPELFPLTTREQEKYQFGLAGEETWRGPPVYRVAFQPKRREGVLDMDSNSGFRRADVSSTIRYEGIP